MYTYLTFLSVLSYFYEYIFYLYVYFVIIFVQWKKEIQFWKLCNIMKVFKVPLF